MKMDWSLVVHNPDLTLGSIFKTIDDWEYDVIKRMSIVNIIVCI